MCEVVSLIDYKKKLDLKREEEEISLLREKIALLSDELSDLESSPFYNPEDTIENLLNGSLILSPSESALFGAYYTLIGEGREDLAELVMGIIEMK